MSATSKKKSFFIGQNKDRQPANPKLQKRLIQIGKLNYVNRHGFLSINEDAWDNVCSETVATLEKEVAKKLKAEIIRARNLIKKARAEPSIENLQAIYKAPQFKFFSMFRQEMGDSFCVRVRSHGLSQTKKSGSIYIINSRLKEHEPDALKLILLRVENELAI